MCYPGGTDGGAPVLPIAREIQLKNDQRAGAGGAGAPVDLHFTRTNGPVDENIDTLMERVGGIRHRDIVREMILAALKAGQENEGRGDLKLMNTTMKEMRFTAKVFGPYRRRRKVSVFGSARCPAGDPCYETAVELGRRLAADGFMVITGGGPGIMQAVNEGAGASHSFGINIRLPFEQKPNPVVAGNPKSINYKYFFNRKVAFLKEADAVVLLPGGFGTLDEGMETLTMIQTGKHDPMPVILLEPPGGGYWKDWSGFVERRLAGSGLIDPEDLGLASVAASPREASAAIRAFYRRYHSLRYVDGTLVIRMLTSIPEPAVAQARERFADLLRPGGDLRLGPCLPEEADDPELADLPRLLVDFNRTRFARLRALIDFINACDLPDTARD